MRKQIASLLLTVIMLFPFGVPSMVYAAAEPTTWVNHNFTLIEKRFLHDENAYAYFLRHSKSGAHLFFLDNDADEKAFSIGFTTPPADNKGANHALEHSILSGSEKYPSKNLFFYLKNNSVATFINAFTEEDKTYYVFKSTNMTDYYNLMDVYLDSVFNPMLLKEQNIFKREGVRIETDDANGIRYNGVVYNEMKSKSRDAEGNAVNLLADKLVDSIFDPSTPVYQSGGGVKDIEDLTWNDLLDVYNTWYRPSNAFIFLSGRQDVERTMAVINDYLLTNEAEPVIVPEEKKLNAPSSPVSYYGLNKNTETADVGFIFSNLRMDQVREIYARDIILDMVREELRGQYPISYIMGDQSGCWSSMAAIFTKVPADKVEMLIKEFQTQLEQYGRGIDKEKHIRFINDYENSSTYYMGWALATALTGFVNADDPFLMLNKSEDFQYLREHPEFFQQVLNLCIINNPYKNCVVVASDFKSDTKEEAALYSPEELERLQKETEQFYQWVEEPDTLEMLATMPVLDINDFRGEKINLDTADMYQEEGITFFHLPSDDNQATLYFPCTVPQEDLLYTALMCRYMGAILSKDIGNNSYTYFDPLENVQNPEKYSLQFLVGFSGSNLAETMSAVSSMFINDTWINDASLEAFLREEQASLQSYFSEPFMLSYEAKLSGLNSTDRLRGMLLGSSGQGSIPYMRFISEVKTGEAVRRMRSIHKSLFVQDGLVVDGKCPIDEFESLKKNIHTGIPAGKCFETVQYQLEGGYNSALTLTKQTENTIHYMQAGMLNVPYSGKLEVLKRILTTNYLLPVMRGKNGAYGVNCYFSQNTMHFSVTGAGSIDNTYNVLAGSGDYIRTLPMTQKELDSYIIAAVNEFDSLYNSGDYSPGLYYITNSSVDAVKQTRNEILSTTIDDIKGYTDAIDYVTEQKRVFVYANMETAGKSGFTFDYVIDASTLEVNKVY